MARKDGPLERDGSGPVSCVTCVEESTDRPDAITYIQVRPISETVTHELPPM